MRVPLLDRSALKSVKSGLNKAKCGVQNCVYEATSVV